MDSISFWKIAGAADKHMHPLECVETGGEDKIRHLDINISNRDLIISQVYYAHVP